MLNIIKSEKLNKGQGKDPVDQGWLNEVYRWEKFDIGPQFNALALLAQEQKNDLMDFIAQQKNSMLNENENIYSYIQNASIIHFTAVMIRSPYKPSFIFSVDTEFVSRE